jgi:hypothetical protein
MTKFLYALLIIGLWSGVNSQNASAATFENTITFEEGLTSPTRPVGILVGSVYSDPGMTTPNLRFHDSDHPTAVPFDFVDGWGAVVDFGVLNTATGFLDFSTTLDYIEVSGKAQSDFALQGTSLTPFSFTIEAFSAQGSLVASATQSFGYDYSIIGPSGPYPLANLNLRVEAVGEIASLQVSTSGIKFGIDSLVFGGEDGELPGCGPSGGVPPKCNETAVIPLPAGLPLLLSGLLGFGILRKRKQLIPVDDER